MIAPNVTMAKMKKIWTGYRMISRKTRLMLFNSCVTPVMTYNLAASGANRAMMDKLDAAHRRHLRRILGYYHPNHIQNATLYKEAQTAPLSLVTTKLRWQLFGHLL